jgi:hypothetical protein
MHEMVLLARLLGALALLVLELSIIHDATDGGLRLGGHFHQIQPLFLGPAQGFITADDANLFSIGSDETYLRNANLLVNADLL